MLCDLKITHIIYFNRHALRRQQPPPPIAQRISTRTWSAAPGTRCTEGSKNVLDRIGRSHAIDDVKCSVELCRDYDLTPIVDVIFGLPGETVTDQQETLDLVGFVVNKSGRIHSHYFTPLPWTPLEYAVPSPVGRDVNRVMGRPALAGKFTGVWE